MIPEPGWIGSRGGIDHSGGTRIMLEGCRGTSQCGARWSMATINDSISGVEHSRQETQTVRRAMIGKDRPCLVIGPT